MELFPYAPRPFQAEAVKLIRSTANDGGHLVLESPTGTGKTVVLLAGALEAALANDKRILYLTRTNSQQEQAIREIRALQARTPRPVRALALQGRQRLCLKLEDSSDPELEAASPEDLSHYCSHAKRLAESEPQDPKACRYFASLTAKSEDELIGAFGPQALTAEAAKLLARGHGFCSYEATKRLLPKADIVVAPYIFAFEPGLRSRLFQWWNSEPARTILIVDEAHNVPGYARELFSPRLTSEALRRALGESEMLGHPILGNNVSARELLESVQEALQLVLDEFVQDEDGFVPPFELEGHLLGRHRLTTHNLSQLADQLDQLGEVVRDRRRLLGKVPRSALGHVGRFLRRWLDADDGTHVKLAVREPRPALEVFCVDAREGARMLHEFHATIHASGTLSPMAEYRDSLGLGDTARLERFPSPFSPERLRIVVAKDLTTRFETLQADPRKVDALQEATRRFVEASRTSTAVFFPSHRMLSEFAEVGVLDGPGQLLVESRNLNQDGLMQLVAQHRAAPGRSVLAGVIGGRLSEGLDFPGRQLESILLVGVPFPKPTARQRSLHRYYEAHYRQGWDYAVKAPALRRIRQAVGRLVRGPTDRGFALILDERAAGLLQSAGTPVDVMGVDDALAAFRSWQSGPPDDTVK